MSMNKQFPFMNKECLDEITNLIHDNMNNNDKFFATWESGWGTEYFNGEVPTNFEDLLSQLDKYFPIITFNMNDKYGSKDSLYMIMFTHQSRINIYKETQMS